MNRLDIDISDLVKRDIAKFRSLDMQPFGEKAADKFLILNFLTFRYPGSNNANTLILKS